MVDWTRFDFNWGFYFIAFAATNSAVAFVVVRSKTSGITAIVHIPPSLPPPPPSPSSAERPHN